MRTQTLRDRLEWIDTQIFAVLQGNPWEVLEPEDRRELKYLTKERRQLSDALAREDKINA